MRLDAYKEMFRHYRNVFSASWKHRHEMEPRKLMAHEAQFLPAALSLQETPPPPAPRVAMWLIITFAFLVLAWSIFGRLDVVATAQGKIVPNDRTKTIQSLEPAIVKAIHIKDGQYVKSGELLIELDASQAQADVNRLKADLAMSRLQVARSDAMMKSIEKGKLQPLERPADVTDEDFKQAEEHFRGQFNEYHSRIQSLRVDIERKQADQASVRETVNKLQLSIPITRDRLTDMEELGKQNFVPRHQVMELRQQLIDQEGDLATQKNRLVETEAAVKQARSQIDSITAEATRIHLDSIEDGRQKESGYSQELSKAQTRDRQLSLRAPVDGVVQQLAVHTIGGVVTSAQPLLVVVPYNETLEVEAFIENRDKGFVRKGQSAEIKVESFPYTKYGVINGEVISVSDDAINDEKRGLIYSTIIRMSKSTMKVNEQEIQLSPGMNVTCEIKTDQRRVIEYFLTPLLSYKAESLKER